MLLSAWRGGVAVAGSGTGAWNGEEMKDEIWVLSNTLFGDTEHSLPRPGDIRSYPHTMIIKHLFPPDVLRSSNRPPAMTERLTSARPDKVGDLTERELFQVVCLFAWAEHVRPW